uniref:tape measure protein n=1 Tax=uncultured Microbacterium sp. TaxID=191216 RepID=UPI0025E1196D
MSFEAAELVATIQLGGAAKADRDLSAFKSKLEQTDSAASKLGRSAEQTFRAAAVGIGVASTAAAAYVTHLFKTGVAYNTLQQTSRAALKTLVGGAEQANAQMDKLDAFAKNSPFSKSVFITAQQQLIGFGVQADKVIPTLDAMQNAVAAVGGGNQQLSELVFILAQVKAAGKITGEDLMQFGQRGVNAAEIIGSQMGKTGAEIRDEITKGTLDASAAIDALVAGMSVKFAGASAGVKQTFTGTVDRIKAASRDIGAALAEPFVGKNGGGLFVTWGNQVADVMRAVEGHVTPVVTMLTARAMPAFAGITETLDRAKVQVKSWDSSQLETSLNQLGAHGPAIAATAGAILGVNSQLLASLPIVGRFIPGFSPIVGILAGAAAASPAVRAEFAGLLGSLKPLVPVTVELSKVASQSLNAVLPVVATGIRAITAVAGPAVDIISKIPAPMLATAAAGVAVFAALRSNMPVLESFVSGWKRLAEQAAVQQALAGMR